MFAQYLPVCVFMTSLSEVYH